MRGYGWGCDTSCVLALLAIVVGIALVITLMSDFVSVLVTVAKGRKRKAPIRQAAKYAVLVGILGTLVSLSIASYETDDGKFEHIAPTWLVALVVFVLSVGVVAGIIWLGRLSERRLHSRGRSNPTQTLDSTQHRT